MPVKKTKTTVVKKTASNRKAEGMFFNWDQWQAMFSESLELWPQLIGRYAGVFVMSLGLQLIGVLALMVGTLWIFGGSETIATTLSGDDSAIENLVANVLVGNVPPLSQLWAFGLSFIAWMLWATVFGIISKIGVLALLRDHYKKQRHSPFHLLFVDGFKHFWRYVWLAIKIFFVAALPALLVFLVAAGWSLFLLASVEAGASVPAVAEKIISLVLTLLFPLTLVYAVYKVISLFFALPYLVYTNTTAAKAWAKTKQLTTGAWWYTFLAWALLVAILIVINEGLVLAAENDPTQWVINLLAFLVAAFILAPVTTAFQFCLMRQVAKNQSIKL